MIGDLVGTGDGKGVGKEVGTGVGSKVGTGVGSGVGKGVGKGVGTEVGTGVGSKVGAGVGLCVGAGVWTIDASLGGCEDVKIEVHVVSVTVLDDVGASVWSCKLLRPRRFFVFNGFALVLATANVQTIKNKTKEENFDIAMESFVELCDKLRKDIVDCAMLFAFACPYSKK